MIDIRDFDPLVGSGNPTLDTAALEAAFLVGGRVYAPGKYLQNRSLIALVPGTEIVGDGKFTSEIKAFAGTKLVKQIEFAAQGCATRDIGFHGNRMNDGTESDGEVGPGNETCAICVTAPHCQVERSQFQEYGWQGVSIRSEGDYFKAKNNDFIRNGSRIDRWGAGLKFWHRRVIDGGSGRIPWGGVVEDNYFAYNYGLGGPVMANGQTAPAGGACALDVVNLSLRNNVCENNYNSGGQMAENGDNGITRRWRGGGNTFSIWNEPTNCSTTDYEVTGLDYSFAGDFTDGGRGSHWNFTPIGNAACGDATIEGAHVINKAAGVMLKNAEPIASAPNPTGGARAVVFGPAVVRGATVAAVYAESQVSNILITGVRWADSVNHVNTVANNLPESQIKYVDCR